MGGGDYSSSELSWAQCVQRIHHFTLLVDGTPTRVNNTEASTQRKI